MIRETTLQAQSNDAVQQAGGLGVLLNHLIALKEKQYFSEFYLTRSSLENVFVQFAKHQIEQVQFNQP